MSDLTVKWRKGISVPVDAKTAYIEVQKIQRRDQVVTPKALVEEARPTTSPLHLAFTWDDLEAAYKYRLYQARRLMNHLVIVDETTDKVMSPAYVNVVVHDASDQRGYVGVEHMDQADIKNQAIAQALKGLEAWQRRYAHLEGPLNLVFKAIDELKKSLES